jgi:sugar/nucleoside kinase (ribokinase family)
VQTIFACPSKRSLLRCSGRRIVQVQGGGNCGNALTAASRLGLSTSIVSKIGGDSLGDGIIAEFERDAVGTGHLLRAAGAPSPFTYIIVDRQGGSGPCLAVEVPAVGCLGSMGHDWHAPCPASQ